MNATRNAAALALALLVAAPALADDLTGTYEGKLTCTSNAAADGVKTTSKLDSVLEITQVQIEGNVIQLHARIDDVLYASRGIAVKGLESGKGVGDFVRCGSNDDASLGNTEIQHYKFGANDANGKGSIKTNGLRNLTDGIQGTGELGSCKGSWKRVSVVDPAIPACE